jgi:hypothetical protein
MEYTTVSLFALIAAMNKPVPFFLDTFFGSEVVSPDSEEIAIDVMLGTKRVSPFVAPHVAGRIVESEGFRTARFAPPHVRDLRPINPRRALRRIPGEAIGGELTAAERDSAIVSMDMADQIDMIDRRLELMAIDALLDGIVTVSGEGYDGNIQINFSRDAQLTVALAGAARWGEAGVSPVDNLIDWCNLVLRLGGVRVTDIIIGADAYRFLRNDAQFEKSVNTQLAGTDAALIRAATLTDGGALIGKLNNLTNIWLYGQRYVDPADGLEKDMFPGHGVALGSSAPAAQGYLGLGAIHDPENGYAAGRHIPDSWIEKNPKRRVIQMSSAPLTVLARPNATGFWLVR